MIMSNKLYNREFDDLEPYFKMKMLGRAIIYGTVYAISSGGGTLIVWMVFFIIEMLMKNNS